MNVVIAVVLTANPDPQRGTTWQPDLVLDVLPRSLSDCKLVVLHDQWPAPIAQAATVPVEFLKVEPGGNPYHHRWQVAADYLYDHPEIKRAWCVDATDVEMLHTPWWDMHDGIVYCGQGAPGDTLGMGWMTDNHPSIRDFAAEHAALPMLNSGTLGADRETLLHFLREFNKRLEQAPDDVTEMAAFNLAVYAHRPLPYAPRWLSRTVTGVQVHTDFRAEDRAHPISFWRHK